MSLKERQQLRNQISAQMSRLKKKEESIFLHKVVREKDDRYVLMVKGICQIITPDMGVQLLNYLKKTWDVKKNAGIAGVLPLKRKNSMSNSDENLYTFMTEHFITKQE